MNNSSILNCLKIDQDSISSFDYLEENNDLLVYCKIKPNHQKCIYCGSDTVIKEYKKHSFNDLSIGMKKTHIELSVPRYKCKKCLKTFTQDTSNYESFHLSNNIIKSLIKDFSSMITFKDLAIKYSTSVTNICNIFDKYCPTMNAKLSDILCIDEFRNTGDNEEKYACILVNFLTHDIVDILPSRTLPYLRRYFGKQPKFALNQVKYIISDMYDGYITIAHEFFPNAKICIDPFHYMEYFTNAIHSIRIRLVKNGIFFKDSSFFKAHWRLLTLDIEKIKNDQIRYKDGTTIDLEYRIRNYVKQDNELSYSYFLLQDYYYLSKHLGKQTPIDFLNHFINRMLQSNIPELIKCGNTWNHYIEYIANSFIFINGKRLSNGPIEGVNSRVKTLKKLYCGYKNKKRFYKRIILILNKKRCEF